MKNTQSCQVTYKGVTYPSMNKACKELGLNYQNIHSRMTRHNLTFKEAVDYKPHSAPHTGKTITYKGVVYPSMKKACEDLGLNWGNIHSRMTRHNLTFEEAIDCKPHASHSGHQVTYKGITYPTIKRACKELGLTYNTIRNRMRNHNLSFEKAVDRGPCKAVTYKGVTFPSIYRACKELGLNYPNIHYRMTRYNLSFAEAVDYKSHSAPRAGKTITYKGVTYPSMDKACIELGLTYATIFYRMTRYNLSFAEAVDYIPYSAPYTAGYQVTYKGVVYPSMNRACKELGLNYQTIRNRMRNHNLSFEEAVDYKPHSAPHADKTITYKGVTYPSMNKACKELGLTYATIFYRMTQHNFTFAEAVDRGPCKAVTYKGITYPSMNRACKELGLNYVNIHYRMTQHNLTFVEAVDYVPCKPHRKAITYKGITYPSISKACKELGLNYININNYMTQHNLTFVEAVDYVPCKLHRKAVTYKGITYPSMNRACKELGLNYVKIHNRMTRHNLTFAEAVDYKKIKG